MHGYFFKKRLRLEAIVITSRSLNQFLWEESRNYFSFGDNYPKFGIENFPWSNGLWGKNGNLNGVRREGRLINNKHSVISTPVKYFSYQMVTHTLPPIYTLQEWHAQRTQPKIHPFSSLRSRCSSFWFADSIHPSILWWSGNWMPLAKQITTNKRK